MSETDYDVIVAGYGPVGETCANLLGYYKIKSLIIDKNDRQIKINDKGYIHTFD